MGVQDTWHLWAHGALPISKYLWGTKTDISFGNQL